MQTQPELETVKAKMLAEELNDLIAYLHIFYMNVKVFEWNINGNNYFELNLKFEKIYSESILSKIDEIAEQILALGFIPDYSFSTYLKKVSIEAISGTAKANKAVQEILESSQVILGLEKKLLEHARKFGEEEICTLMKGYVKDQEKYAVAFTGSMK
jgi:starvation-inducible DNA-binding protein